MPLFGPLVFQQLLMSVFCVSVDVRCIVLHKTDAYTLSFFFNK